MTQSSLEKLTGNVFQKTLGVKQSAEVLYNQCVAAPDVAELRRLSQKMWSSLTNCTAALRAFDAFLEQHERGSS